MQSAIPSSDFLKANYLKILVCIAAFVLLALPSILRWLAKSAAANPSGVAAKVADAIPVTPKATT